MKSFKKNKFSLKVLLLAAALFLAGYSKRSRNADNVGHSTIEQLKAGFLNPPASARPGVYWYFMDGNLSKEGMTADLESMKQAGIGNVIFLEVNVGVPRGPVDFLGEQWFVLFKHAVDECKRLGINMTLGIGPGWAGSGGPWVSPAQSMQHLVSSCINVSGSGNKHIQLPKPQPMKPYFGEGVLTPELKKEWQNFYEDVAVLAFPTPDTSEKISGIYEKALYYRAPYSSVAGVKSYLPSLVQYKSLPAKDIVSKKQILDLTDKLNPDGTLDWKVPEGKWTIMRFGVRNNGAITRPAPVQGLGFESDKFDTVALNSHLEAYVGKMLDKIGKPYSTSSGGLKFLHMDSWEMGAQNWTGNFREEFIKRRGYDPLPFYPVYAGKIVESKEISERFLWDLRQTSQELVLDYHAGQVKKYAHRRGLGLSTEPYDMNPTADLELGAVADIPMCEFWSKGFGFNTSFSCIEATSIAHVKGVPVVQAEAFTGGPEEAWKQYPGSMKNQGDWAFATGINRFFYHTFQHKPLADSLMPGMTMGPYGVHWDRKQTWWPMVAAYHRYISRCQFMLQQGKTVADILYLTPEGAPQVFLPPPSALTGNDTMPDRKGYNFDGCSPRQLYQASVKNNRIVFPGGASYRLLVLPDFKTMTPGLLQKIQALVKDGATVVGAPPIKSPGLSDFPECDQKVQSIAEEVWGTKASPVKQSTHTYGRGTVIFGGALTAGQKESLYPEYELTAKLLGQMHVPVDFESTGPVRYTHRSLENMDIYFVSNRTNKSIKTDCIFRTVKGIPELWNPLTGKTRMLSEFTSNGERTTIPLQFDSYQSFFIVFSKDNSQTPAKKKNYPTEQKLATLSGEWAVSFDSKWGGPGKITFNNLTDWTERPEQGIKYYSGIAVYSKTFDFLNFSGYSKNRLYLDLGEVKNMARVRLNGHDLGVVWTAPWQVDITGILREKGNQLEIEVANLWPNRLIGDQQYPDDGVKDGKWPEWLIKNGKKNSARYSFTTYNPYKKDSPLLSSGLLGPVTIEQTEF
ncbi:glycosyl hydrolase [Hanamia caeni]|uniref:Glycosyl hydrolase n=1 Tax=Hanamia caeni TaxID=2294116 RepID=A0A3M9NQX4_9BACT|nr:glycosyl hydrolase [Hanamia caeni]RNI40222.1 glycosyl hydrolase [Hanamia caeni]